MFTVASKKLRYNHRLAFIIILVLGLILGFPFFRDILQNINCEVDTLTMSAGEITIITPENKTYIQPMNGYFPGIFGFENDEIGSIPQDWGLGKLYGNVEPQIMSGIGGHNKVLGLYDDGGGQSVIIQNFTVGVQSYGTVEFWMRNSDATDPNAIKLRYIDNTNIGPAFMMKDDKWAYALDSGNYDIAGLPTPHDNVWYHLTVHFEARVAGGYQGLNQFEYEIIVNGLHSSGALPFRHNTQVDQIVFFTGSTASNYYFYIDALGYSWHPRYNVGDNLNEGLMLSFVNTTALNWMGYSLDRQPNKTLLGDSTIVMPNDGIHSIQVFGNTSLGENHMSGIRYFTVTSLPVDGPDNTLLIILILVSVLGLVGFISVIVALKSVRKPSEIIETRETRPKKPKKKKPKILKTKWEDQHFMCPFCQNTLPMRQKFCTYCGSDLQEVNQ